MSYNAIFCEQTNRVIDAFPATCDSAERLSKYRGEYGENLIVLCLDEAAQRYEDSFKSEPVEITEKDWTYALECLPPVGWKHGDGGESFKMMERTAGNVTAIYVRIGERHFQFNDNIRTPHPDCVKRVRDWLAKQ